MASRTKHSTVDVYFISPSLDGDSEEGEEEETGEVLERKGGLVYIIMMGPSIHCRRAFSVETGSIQTNSKHMCLLVQSEIIFID
jgi:hypothetical protein